MVAKKITHITMLVHNQQEACDFYTQKLGFKVHTDAEFPGSGRWLTIHPAGQTDFEIALMIAETPEEQAIVGKQGGNKPFMSIEIDDCMATYDAWKKAGVNMVKEPETYPWGTGFVCQDLYGNMLYVLQPAPMNQ